ncbi:DUF7824 domain-containing protein [Nonomuraea rhodomycinica]|uniref:DUF7824 domain-containing protein n=1 Tax=Nonomuraea rhodomycinica TaxID=1712872 RepID=A0A7Y6INR8_9ACTN|nr:DUF6493 family protein [Nonomuraea rhodomycinica]NUW41331.1 hypothetical protein [Nonomuraea rhodomycinica]
MRANDAAWPPVRDLIAAGDVAALVKTVKALDEPARREVARELPGSIAEVRRIVWDEVAAHDARADRDRKERQAELARLYAAGELSEYQYHTAYSMTWEHERGVARPATDRWIEPMRVAGAATIGGAAAVAAWVTRREFDLWVDSPSELEREVEPVLEVVAARPDAWQADLAVRLALRVRARRRPPLADRVLELALALLRRTGATPPEHDPLVVAWARQVPRPGDPLTRHLVPRLFEAEGVGRVLRDDRTWLGRLTRLAARDRSMREMLLDGCRRRFLRGGEGPDLRFFVRLHEELAPAPAEVAPHARDYLRLLPAAPGPVAELALRHVRDLDGLVPEDVVEALEGLVFRAEGGLARAGLGWLAELVKRAPERAGDLAPVLATALGHQAWAVQDRAVRIAVRHAARFPADAVATLRDGVGELPADLRNRMAAAFGGETVPEPRFASDGPEGSEDQEDGRVPATLPAPRRPVPAVAPPGDARSLAEMALDEDGPAAERSLAAFVRLAARDRDALRAALAPLSRQDDWRLRVNELREREWRGHDTWMRALAVELAGPGLGPESLWMLALKAAALLHEVSQEYVERTRARQDRKPGAPAHGDPVPGPRRASPFHRFILRRYAEIHAALAAGTLPPLLLATPSLSTGHVDPADLVARLEELEAAGHEPLPADFQQALLRLPRAVDPAVVRRAGALTSPAGRRAARWMREGGLPDPVVRVTRLGDGEGPRNVGWMTTTVEAAPTGLPLVDELLADQPRHVHYVFDGHLGDMIERWPAVMPSHREVVAAHLVGHEPLEIRWMPSSVLELLADASGPAGRAMALLLAYRIFPRPWIGDCTGPALRALRRIAASGELPAEELGGWLAERALRGEVRTRDLAAVLEAEALNGAHHDVWRVLSTALPPLLPEPGARPTKADTELVALAGRTARWSGARGRHPELAAFAARKGTARALRLARDLDAHLTRP